MEPSTPSWSSSRTDGGRSTTPRNVGRCSRLSTPLAPRISHPQPPERMPSPDILTPNRHHLTFCSACSLVGAGPVSRHLLAPDALKRAPNRSKIDFICYFEGNCGCLETGGLTTTHRLMVNRSWCRCNDRMGARCAPKCPSFEPPFRRFKPPFRAIF